ncbi:MAG: wax ester/triacylglycerol synthase family O-acyltransferase [Steroidobacteraceae bacterium]|nr:wax ester/triacylglycerol synthase family O-acyltransferase [Steroidobacteraceae bacterium]
MSSIDTAWLRMERRTNPMVIVSVIVLGERCTLADLRGLVAERFLQHARFRAVPVDEGIGGTWVDDPYFELEAHVGEVRPAGPSQADLEALVGELASSALDPRRPLWRFDLVPEYGHGSAVVLRIHHCYADGIALVKMFLGLTTRTPEDTARPGAPTLEDVHAEDDALLPWLRSLVGPATAFLGQALRDGEFLVETGLHGLLHPLEALGSAQKAAGVAGGVAGEFAALLRLPDDPRSPLRGTLGTRKQVAWAPPVALAEVRTVARALGCTINDVVMSIVAGTLGRYLRSLGHDTTDLTVRAAVPVNLRPPDEPPCLGNRFGLAFLDLPIGMQHPLERLYAVRRYMRELKGSQQPAAAFVVLSALGYLPAPVQGLAVDTLSRKASAVVSNVPGPRERLYLCGRPIDEMYFWVPQSGSIGLGISVLTYVDEVLFGVVADRTLLPEPHRIVDGFAAEFERLLLLTLLGAAHCERTDA